MCAADTIEGSSISAPGFWADGNQASKLCKGHYSLLLGRFVTILLPKGNESKRQHVGQAFMLVCRPSQSPSVQALHTISTLPNLLAKIQFDWCSKPAHVMQHMQVGLELLKTLVVACIAFIRLQVWHPD